MTATARTFSDPEAITGILPASHDEPLVEIRLIPMCDGECESLEDLAEIAASGDDVAEIELVGVRGLDLDDLFLNEVVTMAERGNRAAIHTLEDHPGRNPGSVLGQDAG